MLVTASRNSSDFASREKPAPPSWVRVSGFRPLVLLIGGVAACFGRAASLTIQSCLSVCQRGLGDGGSWGSRAPTPLRVFNQRSNPCLRTADVAAVGVTGGTRTLVRPLWRRRSFLLDAVPTECRCG